MLRSLVIFCGCLCLVAGVGCGGDSDSGSGVSGDKRVNALTQDELTKLCKNRRDQLGTLSTQMEGVWGNYIKVACVATGLLATWNGGTVAQCESSRDQCVAAWQADAGTGTTGVDAGQSSTCPQPNQVVNCDALVADVDKCTSAQVEAWKKWLSDTQAQIDKTTISCDQAGQPMDLSVFLNNRIATFGTDGGVAECDALYAKCTFLQGS